MPQPTGIFFRSLFRAQVVDNSAPGTSTPWYETTIDVFFILFLVAFVVVTVIWIAIWVHRYFHAVSISGKDWYAAYWLHDDPNDDIAHVSGFRVDSGDWVGEIELTCQVSLGKQEVLWRERRRVDHGFTELPQQCIHATYQPDQDDDVIIVVRAKPRFWCGRPTERIKRPVALNLIDRRTKPSVSSIQSPLNHA